MLFPFSIGKEATNPYYDEAQEIVYKLMDPKPSKL